MKWQAETFWQFSGNAYALHKTRCLYLQDHYQLNVNLILLAIYLNQSKVGINRDDWRCIIDSIATSERQIKQLRRQRRAAKNQHNQQYTELLATELNQEQQQQQLIIDKLNQLHPQSQSQVNNLMNYCLISGLEFDALLINDLAELTKT